MEENTNQTDEQNSKQLKEQLATLIKTLYKFGYNTLSFAEDVDKEKTIEQIKKEIDFKGFNVWILFFSIIIASIGLNVDSIAVIIGAMLISPLMGPIMGIGLSIGTNDYSTLIRSLKSFGTAVVVSLVASTCYFFVSPFGEAGHQLLSRTQPLLFDVFVAAFGGLAGIMAMSRNRMSNVIPGVAIATALMPPLCTAGYGLAHWNFQFFSGAIYLFVINSVYIALATFIVVRYLKFPLVHFSNQERERKIKRYITIFALLLMVPSIFTLWTSYQENRFNSNVKSFVEENFDREYTDVITDYTTDSISVIYIHTNKNENNVTEGTLNKMLPKYDLEDVRVVLTDENAKFRAIQEELNQIKFGGLEMDNNEMLREYKKSMETIRLKDMEIVGLLDQIQKLQSDTMPVSQLLKEAQVHYPKVKRIAFGKIQTASTDTVAQVPTFLVEWQSSYYAKKQKNQMYDWLKIRFKMDTLEVIPF